MQIRVSQTSLFEWIRSVRKRSGALQVSGEANPEHAVLLHTLLEDHVGVVDLVITDNRKRMVSVRKRRGRHEYRVHHMFLGCDQTVVEALVGLSKSQPESRKVIRDFVAENRDSIRARSKKTTLRTDGNVYDLDALIQNVRARFGSEEVLALADVSITWGRKSSGTRSIRLGSFDFERRLIRIHPSLDASWVPAYFLEFVVYHELLHAVVPPEVKGGRRVVHPPEFRDRERDFDRYDEAIAWEQNNLHRLLR